ncbi:MAG: hypothetical protein R3268_04765, partial [Acidiferrobacterales bacterium]|nr:hypothetical protein [Acidiferrobacterales bacterium]
GWLLYAGGPYRGQVIDTEIRQPIEGAVVLIDWRRHVYGGAGGPVKYPHSAREVLTDKEGRFYVPWFVRLSLNPFSVVLEPNWFAYYPGYTPDGVLVTPPSGVPLNDKTVLLMRRVRSRQERLQAVDTFPPDVPNEAMPNLIRLVNNERTALGLKPVHVSSGARQ